MTQREEFEKWAHSIGMEPVAQGNGYTDASMTWAWWGWQSSAARYEPLVEAARRAREVAAELCSCDPDDQSRLCDACEVAAALYLPLAALGDGQ